MNLDLPVILKKHERFRPQTRSFQTDLDSQQLYRSRIRRRNIHQGIEYGEQYVNSLDKIKAEQRRLYGIRKNPRQSIEDIQQIKRDVEKLQVQLASRRQAAGSKKKTYKVNHKRQVRPRVYTESASNHDHIIIEPKKRIQELKPAEIFPEYYKIASPPQKKLYKIKPKPNRFLIDTDYEPASSPSPTQLKIRRYNTHNVYHSDANISSRIKHRLNISRLLRANKNIKNFRKAALAVLFTIRLRTYNERMRKKRMKRFQIFIDDQLGDKLLKLKSTFLHYSKPFFLTIIDQFNFSYRLHDKDEPELKRQKINAVLKLVGIQIKCLEKCIRNMQQTKLFNQTFYLLCKHGNYSCKQEINTNQQLNISCISDTFGYVRAQKYLEQSAIVSLVFIKILLYNILLQPERIDMQVTTKVSPQIIYSNVRLIGNILYEMFIDIQDELLEKAPLSYKVGNWLQLKNKFNFKIAQSMTIKEGFFQKNELVSGLASHNYIQHIYKSHQLTDERHILKELVRILHESIARYHMQFRRQVFIV